MNIPLAFVELNHEMDSMLQHLKYAILARPVPAGAPIPSTQAIITLMLERYGLVLDLTSITYFEPDVVIKLPSKEAQNLVMVDTVLHGNGFTLAICPWTEHSRCHVVPWDTLVSVDVHGLPPHALDPKSLQPLISSYCDIQAYTIDKKKGMCTIHGFAASIESIPTKIFFLLPTPFL